MRHLPSIGSGTIVAEARRPFHVNVSEVRDEKKRVVDCGGEKKSKGEKRREFKSDYFRDVVDTFNYSRDILSASYVRTRYENISVH